MVFVGKNILLVWRHDGLSPAWINIIVPNKVETLFNVALVYFYCK